MSHWAEEHIVRAPFTPEQVLSLNDYQTEQPFHPFTCGHCRDTLGTGLWPDKPYQGPLNERLLVATEEGWTCPTCDYTQKWAWDWMADGSWRTWETLVKLGQNQREDQP